MNIHFSSHSKTWSGSLSAPLWLQRRSHWLRGRRIRFGTWVTSDVDRVDDIANNSSYFADYKYESLDFSINSFRVLSLEPGDFNSPLSGHLRNAFWQDQDLEYEAISYTWGTTHNFDTFVVDGQGVKITRNLSLLLRHIRSPTKSRTLWIDQICINQVDMEEKSNQVQAMGSIYRSAAAVNVWLGETGPNSALALRLLGDLAKEEKTPTECWENLPADILHEGLRDVVSRHWFSRIWPVQEAVLASKCVFICGHDSFEWNSNSLEDLRTIIRRFKYAESHPSWEQAGLRNVSLEPLLNILNLQYRRCLKENQMETPDLDLLDLLHNTRNKISVDPRDKVFGILGLAGEQEFAKANVDYTMTVEQIYNQLIPPRAGS